LVVENKRNKNKKFLKKVKEIIEGNINDVRKRKATCVENTAKKVISKTKSNAYVRNQKNAEVD